MQINCKLREVPFILLLFTKHLFFACTVWLYLYILMCSHSFVSWHSWIVFFLLAKEHLYGICTASLLLRPFHWIEIFSSKYSVERFHLINDWNGLITSLWECAVDLFTSGWHLVGIILLHSCNRDTTSLIKLFSITVSSSSTIHSRNFNLNCLT